MSLEKQNLKWVHDHPNSLLTAMVDVWGAFSSKIETVCLLTVASFLELDDYSTHEWERVTLQDVFDGKVSNVVVEFHLEETSREEYEYPDHALVFCREESQVYLVESWFMKKRPTKREVDFENARARIKDILTGKNYFVYYLACPSS